ncbi:penicillin-binding transpeptidase domain-containing protein [Prescottella sp. R16]|uniref:penicillin-binding transpeptidase domain-containing protein n=1 Tax=Prescottella sp. R16 TaxID=3064529 RepID=UPI00272E2AD6|nr:penicillin-binding transpeptidase domain-containing protein [Prescottella sp. R16]
MTAARRKARRKHVTLALAGTVALTSCGLLGPDSGQDVAGQFTDALADRDVDRAASLTDDPAAAADVLRRTFDGLGADTAATFTVESADDSRFTYRSAWDFGGGRVWDYSSTAALRTVDGDRRIEWSADVVNDRLQPGQAVQFTPIADTRAVLDANAMPLLAPQTVTVVDADPRVLASDPATAARVTSLLGGPVPGFTLPRPDPSSERVNLVSLRQEDAAPIRAELETLPGIVLSDQLRLLTVDRTLTSPLVSGIRQEWESRQQQSSGWRVQTVNPDGEVAGTLAGGDPADGTVVRTTIDPNVQRFAQQAVDTESRASALVALDASSGRVLAVAQNKAADESGPIALTGLYPPGSTFKTITTTAALSDGTVTADSMVDCPGTATIEGRTIPNDDEFDLGRVPLHTAFAHSCNTTMGKLAVGMAPDELQQQALDFGLGVDYVTPGMTTVTGSVPSTDTPAQRVEAAIGQGENLASPFGMAMVAATVGSGRTPLPQLIAGEPGTADHDAQPIDPGRLDALRAMMTETVDAGTATSLTDIPGLMGKTGTAEAGNSAHGWFVGVDGNIAFAVLVVDGDSSRPALDIAGKFLRPLG